jgi:hypothetical protein
VITPLEAPEVLVDLLEVALDNNRVTDKINFTEEEDTERKVCFS